MKALESVTSRAMSKLRHPGTVRPSATTASNAARSCSAFSGLHFALKRTTIIFSSWFWTQVFDNVTCNVLLDAKLPKLMCTSENDICSGPLQLGQRTNAPQDTDRPQAVGLGRRNIHRTIAHHDGHMLNGGILKEGVTICAPLVVWFA